MPSSSSRNRPSKLPSEVETDQEGKERVTQSKEFPQYAWVTPNSYTKGRKPGQPSVIFIHTTEGSEGTHSAEDGAAYDARRTDGTSTHFFVDEDTVVQCVLTTDEAHAARTHGNDVGIQIEECGKAGQTRAQWSDQASAGTIENTAKLCVAIRKKYGASRFPLVNLTPSQLRAGQHGFAEHKDATLAWPEDGGDHTDPGPNYPWDQLFSRIKEIEAPPVTTQFNSDDKAELKAQATAGVLGYNGGGVPHWQGESADPNFLNAFTRLFGMVADIQSNAATVDSQAKLDASIGELKAGLAALQAKVDEIAAAVITPPSQ